MQEYLKHKSTILSFISDIIILTGVFYLGWDAGRGIAFFCLDIEVMIFFFFVFLTLKKELGDVLSPILGFFFLSCIVSVYYFMLLSIENNITNVSTPIKLDQIEELFSPYYDVGFFIFISGLGHAAIVKELLKVKNESSTDLFELKSILYRMLMIPVIFIIGGFISMVIHSDIYTTPFLLFVVLKNVLEYWKFKALKKLKVKLSTI